MVENSINDDIVIIGLVGIRDDVRPEAKEAIREVQGAGIQVVMITGDRLETAVAIAKDAGLLKGGSDRALSSAQLNEMSDEEVKKIIPNIRVIARALPTDKSRMVRLCQEMNLVVGMTGDGVNDSPALKRADVGFAMGSGTAFAYAIDKLQDRGKFFIFPQDEVYAGQVVGEHSHDNDLVINVTKSKKLTNMRASGSDDKVRLIPPVQFSLEEALEYIKEDEYVEVTPKAMRMRKVILDEIERKRANKI